MRHFHEKLKEEHGIELSYSWVKQALQGAGLVVKRKKRGSHRRRRPRRRTATFRQRMSPAARAVLRFSNGLRNSKLFICGPK